ncbi:MAG: 5-amino-6-(5-phosphoribosylamino)uracil reductase [Chloroflexi bacterium]|jgi:diaminohydroxyphosphoribosylaminopyrimidine deaminase/5-amino-6-(5-phosphoribosylamino)uracil reductase|nr:MAG: 5-amino-6-(5-phosphoribosylamino)uracil reductase [Chloroflexota bacterium]
MNQKVVNEANNQSEFMRSALSLGQQALGNTAPNPAVGAVIVKDDKIVGQGFSLPAGRDHAEIVAIRDAKELAKGATLYITLEPCCHTGRTPPCTEAIIKAGIKEVHFSVTDPNPLVSGNGAKLLEQAGIQVCKGEEKETSLKLNEAYFKYIRTKQPFVTAKCATSLDGKIATRSRDSRWISSPEARNWAHKLRGQSDAVMVGIGTIISDDPLLTARDKENRPLEKQPVRIVVDSGLKTPLNANLFTDSNSIIIATSSNSEKKMATLRDLGAEVISLPGAGGLVNLPALLDFLGYREITSVLIEGGSELLGAFFDERLVDKVAFCVSPVIIGGKTAIPSVGATGANKLSEAYRLQDVSVETVGTDFIVTGYSAKSVLNNGRGVTCFQES